MIYSVVPFPVTLSDR